jgi:hypothetical protein
VRNEAFIKLADLLMRCSGANACNHSNKRGVKVNSKGLAGLAGLVE